MRVLLQAAPAQLPAWRDAFARELPDAAIACWPDAPAEVDFALVWKPPPELFERVRVARAIVNLGAGVDAILALPTLPPGVPLYRLEDAGMAEQMAEFAAHAVLHAYREFDAYAEAQRDGRWAPRRRVAKADFGVGLLGFGVLGRAVARALAPFGFPLAAWSRTRHDEPGIASFAGEGEFDGFLARTRVAICLLPSTPSTRGLLDRARLARLPRGAHLVNLARGDLVVEPDLVALLDEGYLAGATLDVFAHEPLPAGHPFWHHPRVRLTPHVSAVTLVDESAAQVAARLRALWRGQPASDAVRRDLGY